MKKSILLFISIVFISIFVNPTCLFAQDYYVSNSGVNSNSGMSEDSPWQTVEKVNSTAFVAGDVIHFKSGDAWREQLRPASGNENGYITYTSYGVGDKPLLLGSVNRSNKDNWKYEGNNIWILQSVDSVSNMDISSAKIDISPAKIRLWNEGSSDVSSEVIEDGQNTSYALKCNNPGNKTSDIQIILLNGLNIKRDHSYNIVFSAKSTKSFKIPPIKLMKSTSPWTNYARVSNGSPDITTEWKDYSVSFQANAEDENARITIGLGNSIPADTTLYINSISYNEIKESGINRDVGNIIFDQGKEVGIKVFNENELKEQNYFWYDKENDTVKIYSSKNPAELYNSIECAITKNIIDETDKSYIKYDGLALKYGGAHGIGGGNTHHIWVSNCDINYIGGGELVKGKGNRYGNGIEFWNNTHDNIVEKCNIGEIFDAALTNQGNGVAIKQYNISYRNNIIWNAEYSFEYFNYSKDGENK
ncbi:hypothetical protein UF75_2944 [Desulfosporosinus sp. I2]|uniref:carbohydrate binding domain-containing protein n=1 Tax=Desulfosporosinus sp. I2 TaxID=1617025 RepID=UPI0005EF8643|nr:carbohydrate binding domain-containing protein [Desulfosporosinus sp. I2]KJR46650.1 hypothetical protein UF75_2944 [Desulfosporosinus sp. I2]